jgi:hypothetical protein
MRKILVRIAASIAAQRCSAVGWPGCAGLPQHVQKFPSEALANPANTTLGRLVEASRGRSKNLSGIRLLASGEEALAS